MLVVHLLYIRRGKKGSVILLVENVFEDFLLATISRYRDIVRVFPTGWNGVPTSNHNFDPKVSITHYRRDAWKKLYHSTCYVPGSRQADIVVTNYPARDRRSGWPQSAIRIEVVRSWASLHRTSSVTTSLLGSIENAAEVLNLEGGTDRYVNEVISFCGDHDHGSSTTVTNQ